MTGAAMRRAGSGLEQMTKIAAEAGQTAEKMKSSSRPDRGRQVANQQTGRAENQRKTRTDERSRSQHVGLTRMAPFHSRSMQTSIMGTAALLHSLSWACLQRGQKDLAERAQRVRTRSVTVRTKPLPTSVLYGTFGDHYENLKMGIFLNQSSPHALRMCLGLTGHVSVGLDSELSNEAAHNPSMSAF